ncbi:SpoIIE family protein phosphatase [Streptomyces sp. NPDC005474]|uniref:SpoIIE family protein phosphatase n=1 Tax=Streptomyces sp. NPDC005474 TaxID=3154878 RepID=UPI0034521307
MTLHRASAKPPPEDLFDTVCTSTATIDDRGLVTGWSEGARRLLGYRRAQILGRPAATLTRATITPAALASASNRMTWSGTVALRHQDGHRVDLDLLVRRRRTRQGADWLLIAGSLPQGLELADSAAQHTFLQAPCILALFDPELRLIRANADMERSVGLTEKQMQGLRFTEIVPDNRDVEKTARACLRVLATGKRQQLENYLRVPGEAREHAWAVDLAPLRDADRICGVCFVARDTTVLYEAQQRLQLVNEASARIGSTLDVSRTAQELADVAVGRLADFVTVDLLASYGHDAEPAGLPPTGPIQLLRTAQQSVLTGCPESATALHETVTYPASCPPAQCMTAGQGALYETTDQAITQWTAHDPHMAALQHVHGLHSLIVVPIRARDTALGTAAFFRHQRPDPFTGDDLLLAEELTARAAVCIDNARRYTHERTTAVTLQRNLLPHKLPDQAALDVASRYRPAGGRAGVGGDWFDVIPLSGARVALAVGDVVGHGLQASATMGRLRTAVRTLADIDLPPDELLTHLDDLVLRPAAEAGTEAAGEIGATCLYAVYDPISRRCTVATAGHPVPLMVTPNRSAEVLDVPVGPPLGLGGLPFETIEVELPEGSLLALYTDGLIETRDRDIDQGITKLRGILSEPRPSLSDVCDTVLGAMVVSDPADDVAFLVARTLALGPDQVAVWDIPSDVQAVAKARQDASAQVADWGLEECLFTTELVISELVTNAIRYGQPPVQMRLIRDRNLICEVSDASSTAPHLRRARVFDEGGRGLLLVAQLTQRWGTRYGPRGKTIWAEQTLPSGACVA